MAKSLHARLVAYRPFGARIGILAMPVSFSASMLHDDDGAISIEYSLLSGDAQAFDRKLTDGLEIAVEVSDGSGYVEPDNARFVITGRSGKTDDRTRTVTYSGQSIGWLLSKAENNDSSHLLADGDNKGKRPFYSSNPGTILKTLLDENRQRGGIATGLTLGFDTAKDSAGAAWAKKYTLYYSLGTDLQTILSSLVNGGGCDWRTSARTLKLWNADGTALSRDLSKSIVLQLGRDISEAPFEESIADLASTILVEGDNDLLFRMDNPAAPTPWGKWESYSSQGGVSDKDTAQAFMQSTLDDAARVRGQYTRDLIVNGVDSLPLVDYHAGDWITAPTVNHGEKVRVQEIDLSMRQNEGLSASIALNDIKYDASVRQAKKIKGITGGAALAGSESGTTASSDHDHRVPKAPQGLVVQTDAYIGSDGYAHGLATAMWSAVSEATNDTAIEISNYAIEWRKHVDGAPWHSAGTTDKTQLGFGGLDCGMQVEVRVRAVPTYSDHFGEWSEIIVATVESDVTPCSVPSKPVLSSELGVVTIHWDGKTSTGASMEADFDHVEVGEGATVAGMQVISATQAGQGDYLVTGLPAGSEHTYALRSVDHAGNRSAWSETASVTVASAVSPEEVKQIQADLAANQTALKDNTSKLAQAQKDIQANKTSIDALNDSTLPGLNADLTQAKKDIQANQTAIASANQTLAQANADLTQAKKDIAANRTAQAETAKQLDSAKSDIKANQTAIDAANQTLTAETAKLAQAQKDIVQAQSDITSVTGDVEQAKADILTNAEQAKQAQKTADAAATAAGTAQDTADKAQAAAGTAQSTADAAKTASASATTTAEQAKKVADAADKAAESAKTTATNAETLANTASETADAAKSDAADAKSVAASASSVATQSKATADSAAQAATDAAGVARQADSAAAAAAGIANGKADVLIQSSTPDSSMCKATTLWIDTTGGANTPKRWTGSAWSAVTDKAATDAADTAVKANDAAKTAQSTADKAATAAANAQSQANQAQAAAQKAQTTADGKNLIYRGPDEPAHDGLKPGDMWWRTQAYWTRWEGDANASPSDLADFYTYWQGEPNASPSVLVPLTDCVIEVLTWNGTSFEPFDLVANNILASGSVAAKHLASDSVTTDKLAANAVTADKLTANSVTTDKLVADAVTAAKLAADSVTARNITALAVTTDKLAANAVTTAKLKVTEDMTVALLDAHRIQADDIVSGAITVDKLAVDSVTADKLAANAVTADKVQAGAIGTDKLAANAVTADKIKAGEVKAENIAAEAITTDKLAANAVNADKLAALAVTTDKLAAGAVNADKLAANSINADKIVSGAITTDKLAANSVTAVKIAAGTITSDKVAAGQFKGYVFTGAVFQSSETDKTGFKLKDGSLDMWDSTHTLTVHLDGEGKNNVLTGTFRTAVSGPRIQITPDTGSQAIGGSESYSGKSISFMSPNFASSPEIMGVYSSSLVGDMSELDMWSGYKTAEDPGAFGRLKSKPRTKGATGSGVTSEVYFTANTNYSGSTTNKSSAELALTGIGGSGATAYLTAYTPSGGTSKAGVWAKKGDVKVGMSADADAKYVYFGGKLGSFGGKSSNTTQATFLQRFWKCFSGGSGTGDYGIGKMTWEPPDYGYYRFVASADASMNFSCVHTGYDSDSNTSTCSCQIRGYGNMGDDIYVCAFGFLRS